MTEKTVTIHEALAEVRLCEKKLDKKSQFILANLKRRAEHVDPLQDVGGSEEAIKQHLQAIRDLHERIVKIRSVIAQANLNTKLKVLTYEFTVTEWLVWKREIAPWQEKFARQVLRGIEYDMISETLPEDSKGIVLHINTKIFLDTYEEFLEIVETLDGQLSLNNATVTVTY